MKNKYFLLYGLSATLLMTVHISRAQEKTIDSGVEINGVVWATRNVNAPGTFTKKPTDAGMLYQWNRKVGWSMVDPVKATDGREEWNGSGAREMSRNQGSKWLPENDPCPNGWRVPTSDEIAKLCRAKNVNSEWIKETVTSAGRKFTDNKNGNSIFIPVTAFRASKTGRLSNEMMRSTDDGYGEYWSSSSQGDYADGWRFNDQNIFAKVPSIWTNAQSIRCVRSDGAYDSARLSAPTSTSSDTELDFYNMPAPGKPGQGVEINGVVWATCNLDAPGTFAEKSTDQGMFYQWNKNVGWSVSGPLKTIDGSTSWDTVAFPKEIVVWSPENDPCPEGWRVPTPEEIEMLCDTKKVANWIIHSPRGCNFSDRENENMIFFPVCGYRSFTDGQLQKANQYGCYWSDSAKEGTAMAYILGIYSFPKAGSTSIYKNSGINIRCVAK